MSLRKVLKLRFCKRHARFWFHACRDCQRVRYQ